MQIFYADMQSFRYCLVQILHVCRSVLSFSKSVDTHTQLLCKFYREEPDGHTLQMLRQFYTVLRSTNALFIHLFHPSYHFPFSFFYALSNFSSCFKLNIFFWSRASLFFYSVSLSFLFLASLALLYLLCFSLSLALSLLFLLFLSRLSLSLSLVPLSSSFDLEPSSSFASPLFCLTPFSFCSFACLLSLLVLVSLL